MCYFEDRYNYTTEEFKNLQQRYDLPGKMRTGVLKIERDNFRSTFNQLVYFLVLYSDIITSGSWLLKYCYLFGEI